jgi:hypothetical protein
VTRAAPAPPPRRSTANRRGMSGRSVRSAGPSGRPGRLGAESPQRGVVASRESDRAGFPSEPVGNDVEPDGRRATAGPDPARSGPGRDRAGGRIGCRFSVPGPPSPPPGLVWPSEVLLLMSPAVPVRFGRSFVNLRCLLGREAPDVTLHGRAGSLPSTVPCSVDGGRGRRDRQGHPVAGGHKTSRLMSGNWWKRRGGGHGGPRILPLTSGAGLHALRVTPVGRHEPSSLSPAWPKTLDSGHPVDRPEIPGNPAVLMGYRSRGSWPGDRAGLLGPLQSDSSSPKRNGSFFRGFWGVAILGDRNCPAATGCP